MLFPPSSIYSAVYTIRGGDETTAHDISDFLDEGNRLTRLN